MGRGDILITCSVTLTWRESDAESSLVNTKCHFRLIFFSVVCQGFLLQHLIKNTQTRIYT